MMDRVLILAPYCDGTDVGEAWAAHQWVEAIGRERAVTLLTLNRSGRPPASRQLPHVEVIEWPDMPVPARLERLSSMLKPGYVRFYRRARHWIGHAFAQGRHFDVFHQLNPIAMRYPSPAAGFGIPFLIGPLAGSLETPSGFAKECRSAPLFVRLRGLDRIRFKRDPLLRHTYASADTVIGVAPYVRDVLSDLAIGKFAVCAETGIHRLAGSAQPRRRRDGGVRLLHVGRAVRTKGLRDCIRALAKLNDLPNVTLTAAGRGEELDVCRREAAALGVASRVTFTGQIPRERIEELYAQSDIFMFPSFREPSGSVVFESMRHGLPVIAADRGGPAYVVDDTAGIRVCPVTPRQFADDLACAVRRLVSNPSMTERLGLGARKRAAEIGLWENRVRWMLDRYRTAIESRSQIERDVAK